MSSAACVGARLHGQAALVEMDLHGVGIGDGHDHSGAGPPHRADGAEQIGALVALVLGLAWPSAFARPLADQAVLLADPHLVLPPEFNLGTPGQMPYRRRERAREVFFKPLQHRRVLLRVFGARAQVREAQIVEQPGDRALVVRHTKALLDDLLEVDPAPTHDPVGRRIGAGLDDLSQRRELDWRQLGLGAGSCAVDQPVGPGLVEAVDPVPQSLAVHAADLRRARPRQTVIDRRDRQQPAGLGRVRRRPSRLPNQPSVEVIP